MMYKDLPLIRLRDALKQEEWYKLSDGRFETDANEADYNNKGIRPIRASVYFKYKDEECRIDVKAFGVTFKIKFIEPTYCLPRRQKAKRPSKVDRAVNKIRDMFLEAIPGIDEHVEAKLEAQIRAAEFEAKKSEIMSDLGVSLQTDRWNQCQLVFRMSKNFSLTFDIDDIDKKTFFGLQFRGTYNLEQVKKLIDFLSECPQAAADRILQGK